jgi:hypothetical protein
MPLPSLRSAKDTTGTTCTLWFIRRELGQHGYSDRRMVAYVTQLIDQHDFPRPLPAMCKGGALTSAVTSNSTWPRAAVEAWIEGWLPGRHRRPRSQGPRRRRRQHGRQRAQPAPRRRSRPQGAA